VLTILQLRETLYSVTTLVASSVLFAMCYLSVGWGSEAGDGYGVLLVALGTPLYFISLFLAIRSKMRPLQSLIVILGIVLALLVLFACAEPFLEPSSPYRPKWWFPTLVILIPTINALTFGRFLRSRKRRDDAALLTSSRSTSDASG
jgi:hypothetical protein